MKDQKMEGSVKSIDGNTGTIMLSMNGESREVPVEL